MLTRPGPAPFYHRSPSCPCPSCAPSPSASCRCWTRCADREQIGGERKPKRKKKKLLNHQPTPPSQGERDDKIIAVHADDPEYRGFNDIAELPVHRLNEIRRFFEDYKKNEHKEVRVDEFLGADAAKQCIKESMEMYAEHYLPKRQR